MENQNLVLKGKHIRLEPLQLHHAEALQAAADADRSLYTWSLVPSGKEGIAKYIATAIAGREAGTAQPFATVRVSDAAVIGSTRFYEMTRWAWPATHERHGRGLVDTCEIGHTWLTHSAIRSAANTEAKLLMLTHAFETWQTLRVSLFTDARNLRSRMAIERMGAKLEGILRSHRMASDYIPRDSAAYAMVAAEWPEAKARLTARLNERS